MPGGLIVDCHSHRELKHRCEVACHIRLQSWDWSLSSKVVQCGEADSGGEILFCEDFLQRPQRGGERFCRDYSQFLRQPGLVHGTNLIEQYQAPPATMSDADTKRRLVTRRCHGCDEYRTQMIVHFGRGHYQTRARLPDFTPDGRIKIHEPNLSARHQTNSESSALLNSPITSSSSPASAILLAASAQPLRAGLAGLRNTSAPSSLVISAPALLSRPSCASTGLGMTTPWELPICRMLTCTARIVITMLFRRAGRVKRADASIAPRAPPFIGARPAERGKISHLALRCSTSVTELHIRTSELVREAEEGGVIVIERRGEPVAELRPITAPARMPAATKARIFDCMREIWARMPQVADSSKIIEEDRDR